MAAGQIYKGKNVRISLEGKTLWHGTEASITISTNMEAIATKDTNGTVNSPSNYEWSASLSGLVADKAAENLTQHGFKDILAFQLANTELDFEFTTDDVGDFVLSGKVYINNAEMTAAVEGSMTGSFQFTGNGDLTLAVVS